MMVRNIVGATRNTPKMAIYVLVEVPPFHIVIKESVARTVARYGLWVNGFQVGVGTLK